MIINTVIVCTGYLAFGPEGAWGYLLVFAVLADAFNVLIKPLRLKLPVIGLADIRKCSEALGDVTTRKDGKPFTELDEKDVKGGYL